MEQNKSLDIRALEIIMRAIYRMKIIGKENLEENNSPSVFVCNHEFIFGPVSSVHYLPVHFRPWINREMLDKDEAAEKIRKILKPMASIFGQHIVKRFSNFLSGILCRILHSYNPIPVVRESSRKNMTTFEESLHALANGENILLFPEKSRYTSDLTKLKDDQADPLDIFYTGFAHLGKMYYDKTGKSLLFYPLYSDKGKRKFIIGKPIKYDYSLEARKSKNMLARQLRTGMRFLRSA